MPKPLSKKQYLRQKMHCDGYDVARYNLRDTAQQLRLRAEALKENSPALATLEADALTEFPSKLMFAWLFEMKPFEDGVVIRFLTKKYPNRIVQHGFVFPDNDEPSHHASLVSGLYTPFANQIENGVHEIAEKPDNHVFTHQLLGKVTRSAMLEWQNVPKLLLHITGTETPQSTIPEQRTLTVESAAAAAFSGRLTVSDSL